MINIANINKQPSWLYPFYFSYIFSNTLTHESHYKTWRQKQSNFQSRLYTSYALRSLMWSLREPSSRVLRLWSASASRSCANTNDNDQSLRFRLKKTVIYRETLFSCTRINLLLLLMNQIFSEIHHIFFTNFIRDNKTCSLSVKLNSFHRFKYVQWMMLYYRYFMYRTVSYSKPKDTLHRKR